MSCSASKLRVSRVENVVPLHRGMRTTHPPHLVPRLLDLRSRSRHLTELTFITARGVYFIPSPRVMLVFIYINTLPITIVILQLFIT